MFQKIPSDMKRLKIGETILSGSATQTCARANANPFQWDDHRNKISRLTVGLERTNWDLRDRGRRNTVARPRDMGIMR